MLAVRVQRPVLHSKRHTTNDARLRFIGTGNRQEIALRTIMCLFGPCDLARVARLKGKDISMRFPKRQLAALAIICMASPAFAASTVRVVEGGEAGRPMTLTLDQTTVKAGATTFLVHNDAMTQEHEMVLVKLKSADQKIDVIAARHRVDEKQLKSLGEVSELKPGADGKLNATLAAGSYLLLCNIKGHYEAGMHAVLTVTD